MDSEAGPVLFCFFALRKTCLARQYAHDYVGMISIILSIMGDKSYFAVSVMAKAEQT